MSVHFDKLNTFQKVEWLSDMLGEACFTVDYCSYQDMNKEQKENVKNKFYTLLKENQITIDEITIDEAERLYNSSPLPFLLRFYKYHTCGHFSIALEQLTPGRKVTIVKLNDFGFPVAFQTVISSVTIEPYAQYNESLKIVHRPKRKRSLYSNRLLPSESVLIYDGWLTIDVDKLTNKIVKDTDTITVKQSRYSSFDKRYLRDALNNIKQEPIVFINVK